MGLQFELDLTGARALDPFVELPTSAYAVKLTGYDKKTDKNGKDGVIWNVVVDEGQYAGAPQSVYMSLDLSDDDARRKTVNSWFTFFLSIGAPQDKLSGKVRLDLDKYIGKRGYIWVQAAPDGESKDGERAYSRRNFIRPEAYERMKRSAPAQAGASNGTANGASGFVPSTPQPNAGAANAQLDF